MIAATHPGRTLLAMTGSLSMIFLDATVVGVALPTIQTELNMTTGQTAWVVNAFLVAFASSLAIGGRLADRIGRLITFRSAMLLFIAGSLVCGLASGPLLLLMARAVQGLAAGLMQPASTAIVIGAVAPDRRGRAMATYFGVSMLFLMGGPVIGGVIVQYADWAWIFLLNLPVGLLALSATIHLGLPPQAPSTRPFDLIGAGLLITGLPSFILGLEWLGHPVKDALWLAPTLAAVGALLTFGCIWQSWRAPSPLLEIRLLAPKVMSSQALVLALATLIMCAQTVYGAIYLQEVLAFSPMQAGLGSLPLLLPVVLVIRTAGTMYDRMGSAKLVVVGFAIAFIGLMIETAGVLLHSYVILAIGMMLVGGGSTFASTPANTDLLSRAPGDRRAEVSGIIQTMRQLGGSLGIVICVIAIGLTVRASMPSQMPNTPDGQIAKRALEGDVPAIRQLEEVNPDLAKTLSQARTNGLAAAFGIQAIAALLALLIAAWWLLPATAQEKRAPSASDHQ